MNINKIKKYLTKNYEMYEFFFIIFGIKKLCISDNKIICFNSYDTINVIIIFNFDLENEENIFLHEIYSRIIPYHSLFQASLLICNQNNDVLEKNNYIETFNPDVNTLIDISYFFFPIRKTLKYLIYDCLVLNFPENKIKYITHQFNLYVKTDNYFIALNSFDRLFIIKYKLNPNPYIYFFFKNISDNTEYKYNMLCVGGETLMINTYMSYRPLHIHRIFHDIRFCFI